LLMAIAQLPEALHKPFEWYLGHSIREMVYEHQRSGTNFGELWINRWQDYVADVFDCMILLSVIWAVVNLGRRRAERTNVAALLVTFGWLMLILWASGMSMLF